MAAHGGFDSMARALIENGIDINHRNILGTALDMALEMDHTSLAWLMVEHGAIVRPRDDAYRLLMEDGATRGRIDSVHRLLDECEGAEMLREASSSALLLAARGGHLDLVRLLIEKGADVNYKSDNGSALTHAILSGNEAITRLLQENGAKQETM